MEGALDVVAGPQLDGARGDTSEPVSVGRLVVGPAGLLGDLELRLGLTAAAEDRPLRVARYSARLAKLAPAGRFYSASYTVDSWGTASQLLDWRDQLVESGWDGAPIADGGARLEQLAELERPDGEALFASAAGDRLREVAALLVTGRQVPYRELTLVEPEVAWPGRWRAIFTLLAERGCRLVRWQPSLPLADGATDLGRLQRQLLHGGDFVPPSGDGTLLFLRGETTWETAFATASCLAGLSDGVARTVVIRTVDAWPLDCALAANGLPRQGTTSTSRLRPLLQVLPLALELLFEPKDPYRILELVSLPGGPFSGLPSRYIAAALAEMPGVGSAAWERAKVEIGAAYERWASQGAAQDAASGAQEASARALTRIADWLEAAGHPQSGAPRAALLDAIERVQQWLQAKLARSDGDESQGALLATAYAQAATLATVLASEPRAHWSLVELRQLIEQIVGDGGTRQRTLEEAGRIDHVASPSALFAAAPTVVWWGCTEAAAEAPRLVPWSRRERSALQDAGVQLVDPRLAMAERAVAWRRAVLAATERCILVAPRFDRGEPVAVHPLWDELTARLGGRREALARVSVEARSLMEGLAPPRLPAPRVVRQPEQPLPPSSVSWTLPPELIGPIERFSASRLETLLGCPLRWALRYRADLRSGDLVTIPEEHTLYGKLGHRLVELLHAEKAFALRGEPLRQRALQKLREIIPCEAATLLLLGRQGERSHVERELTRAMVRFGELLGESGLTLSAVEHTEIVTWQGRPLEGRFDVLLANDRGEDVIVDLKWGRKRHEDRLRDGTAIQLAVYAYVRKSTTNTRAFPSVGYFSLSAQQMLTTDQRLAGSLGPVRGEDIADTWMRVDRTATLVDAHVASGRLPVTGVAGGLPVHQSCGVAPDSAGHFELPPNAACGYCEYDVICGRRWENQR